MIRFICWVLIFNFIVFVILLFLFEVIVFFFSNWLFCFEFIFCFFDKDWVELLLIVLFGLGCFFFILVLLILEIFLLFCDGFVGDFEEWVFFLFFCLLCVYNFSFFDSLCFSFLSLVFFWAIRLDVVDFFGVLGVDEVGFFWGMFFCFFVIWWKRIRY